MQPIPRLLSALLGVFGGPILGGLIGLAAAFVVKDPLLGLLLLVVCIVVGAVLGAVAGFGLPAFREWKQGAETEKVQQRVQTEIIQDERVWPPAPKG